LEIGYIFLFYHTFYDLIHARLVDYHFLYDVYFMQVFGWLIGFSFSVASFFRGHGLQFYCWYGNWGIYCDWVVVPFELSIICAF